MNPTITTNGLSPVLLRVRPRATSSVDTFLSLIADPFSSTLSTTSFYSALGLSFGGVIVIAALFSLARPYNNIVYAPRSKHADEKHAPPPLGKGYFDWIEPVVKTKEQQLVDKVGLDATLFLRFAKMSRNIFLCFTVLGCGILIPVNIIAGASEADSFSTGSLTYFTRLTPIYTQGVYFWAYVVLAYAFNLIICFFLWHNYRAVLRLRRAYFDSPEYQKSLHSRTLLVTDIPKALRTDEGLVTIAEDVKRTDNAPWTAIARNVKDLPELVEEHDDAVRELEAVLAKYLKNPNKLPAKRPTCTVHKADKAYRKGQKVDAIEYLTSRIRELEIEVKQVRESIDKRNAMSYGFASYDVIADAHSVAFAARKKTSHGTHVRLAPKPQDLIWKNLAMGSKQRGWNRFMNNLWVAVLTLLWTVPNALIAIFLSELSNLGQVWPAFQTSLEAHPTLWAIVQGIAAPALTNLFYLVLPIIFRRLSIKAGDLTKTSRERHVMHKLYTFFVFNNLIVFSLFAAIFKYVTTVISERQNNEGVWEAIKGGQLFQKGIISLIGVATYWLTWLLQRNLGAAVDLAQIINLAWGGFSRHFLSPTPRELIELSAPQHFDYAGYYNYFLFYATVAVTFATIQPLVLPVTAFYFALDSYLKKYLLLYVCITKTESGGSFWRVLFNRYIFLSILGNLVIALLDGAKGSSWTQLYCIIPAPFVMIAFKLYCKQAYDNKLAYYRINKTAGDLEAPQAPVGKSKRSDRVGVRFGNPVLYKPLITPMVHAKSQHLLKSIYSGRTSEILDGASVAGFSDIYMDPMSRDQPGRTAAGPAPFEIVSEHQMDFEYYKNRPEFRDEMGGDGELYGRPTDLIRRGSASTRMTDDTTPPDRSRSDSRDSSMTRVAGDNAGTVYPQGYHKAPNVLRDHSPAASSIHSMDIGGMRGRGESQDRGALLSSAARMGMSPPPPMTADYGQIRMGGPVFTPGESGDEETSYDYFRRGRQL